MSVKEPTFKPRPGQVDYTNIRWAPVINCVLQYEGKILIVQRNPNMRLYPGYWNGVSGFLDDHRSLEQKVRDELREELSLAEDQIDSITLGTIFDQEGPSYKKTWIVHPVLVKVKTDALKLDWEAQQYAWVLPQEAKNYNLLPGFEDVLKALSLL